MALDDAAGDAISSLVRSSTGFLCALDNGDAERLSCGSSATGPLLRPRRGGLLMMEIPKQ